jgi:hypothetical protein
MINQVRLLLNPRVPDGDVAVIRQGVAIYTGPLAGVPEFKARDVIYVNDATYDELKRYTIGLGVERN